MSPYFLFEQDISILDVNTLFQEIEIKIVDDLYKYKLLGDKINIEVKRFFYHHLIYEICEAYIKSPTTRSVVFFNYTQIESNILCKFMAEQEVLSLIMSVMLKIQKTLPLKVYLSKYSLTYLKHQIDTKDGRALNIVQHLKELSLAPINTSITFQKIKNFTKKYGLYYLNQEYFNKISTKHLYIK